MLTCCNLTQPNASNDCWSSRSCYKTTTLCLTYLKKVSATRRISTYRMYKKPCPARKRLHSSPIPWHTPASTMTTIHRSACFVGAVLSIHCKYIDITCDQFMQWSAWHFVKVRDWDFSTQHQTNRTLLTVGRYLPAVIFPLWSMRSFMWPTVFTNFKMKVLWPRAGILLISTLNLF